MNFTAFSAASAAGTHFVTTTGQIPMTKIQQQNMNNGLQQVVSMVGGVNMGDGVQYIRTIDGGATLQQTPQIITLPIAMPGAKPGDPQPTVQIQVLNPHILQQQPKYQMQIPIQGFSQGGAVLTVAYNPETNENGGIQLLGNSLPEGTFRMRTGLQVVTALPQDMQMMQPTHAQTQDNKEHVQNQLLISQNQILISNCQDEKIAVNNNTSTDNNNPEAEHYIVVKEECIENNDDECSGDAEGSENAPSTEKTPWKMSASGQHDLLQYLSQLPPQQTQALPASLQQFLRMNPSDLKKSEPLEIEVPALNEQQKEVAIAEAVVDEDGSVRIQAKKKKKYKKRAAGSARPRPGQVVIAAAADGSPVYCCPECALAYADKAALEAHLAAHNLERRFICGICGAGLKRKEHLERHKLGHNPERPYVCGVCQKGFKRREHLNLHTVIHSGVKSETCNLCGKGFYRKDHLRKHTRSHEAKRIREKAQETDAARSKDTPTIMPEITIHVPTSTNSQIPIQINIPQHVVTSLQQAQQQQPQQSQTQSDEQAQLVALLGQHT